MCRSDMRWCGRCAAGRYHCFQAAHRTPWPRTKTSWNLWKIERSWQVTMPILFATISFWCRDSIVDLCTFRGVRWKCVAHSLICRGVPCTYLTWLFQSVICDLSLTNWYVIIYPATSCTGNHGVETYRVRILAIGMVHSTQVDPDLTDAAERLWPSTETSAEKEHHQFIEAVGLQMYPHPTSKHMSDLLEETYWPYFSLYNVHFSIGPPKYMGDQICSSCCLNLDLLRNLHRKLKRYSNCWQWNGRETDASHAYFSWRAGLSDVNCGTWSSRHGGGLHGQTRSTDARTCLQQLMSGNHEQLALHAGSVKRHAGRYLDVVDFQGLTLLHLAVISHDLHAVCILLQVRNIWVRNFAYSTLREGGFHCARCTISSYTYVVEGRCVKELWAV